jgi:hypothetical protein
MSAQCAICLNPVTKGMKFVLAGTEVFHDECAAFRGTHTSIGNRRHKQLVELEGQNAAIRRDHEQIGTTLRILKEKVVKEMDLYVQRLEDSESNVNSWRRRFELARTDLERMTVERDQARRELAIMRQYPPAQAATATPEQKPKDARDDTEIRFSLLEIDSD